MVLATDGDVEREIDVVEVDRGADPELSEILVRVLLTTLVATEVSVTVGVSVAEVLVEVGGSVGSPGQPQPSQSQKYTDSS